MTLNAFKDFLGKKGFRVDPRDGSYIKVVRDMNKRYVIKDNQIYMESKMKYESSYKLVAFADVREVYISDNDKLNGFNRYIPVPKDTQ